MSFKGQLWQMWSIQRFTYFISPFATIQRPEGCCLIGSCVTSIRLTVLRRQTDWQPISQVHPI